MDTAIAPPTALQIQLRDGILAAKSGNKARARELLDQVTEQDPNNEVAWLWSASVQDDPRISYDCLARVLELNPANEGARKGIKHIRVRAGVAFAKGGNLTQARKVLTDALKEEPNNELALLWLAGLTNSPTQAIAMLERVLQINPHNENAKAGLARLRKAMPQPPQAWACPYCLQPQPGKPNRCPSCSAVVDLDMIDGLLDNPDADEKKIGQGLRRLLTENDPAQAATNSLYLGLGFLNLGRLAEGLPHLRDAHRLASEKGNKPALQLLIQRVQQLLRQQAEEERDAARKFILVVDDSPTIRKVVAATLDGTGHRVVTAADATEAIETLRKEAAPDLIFLDINMPGMDGYQLCKLLRQTAATAKVPIIMLSGRDGFFSKIRGRFAGSTDYITKPFKATDLLRAVAKYCGVLPALEEVADDALPELQAVGQ